MEVIFIASDTGRTQPNDCTMATKSSSLNRLTWYGPWNSVFSAGLPTKWQKLLTRWLQQQRWFLDKNNSTATLQLESAQHIDVKGKPVWWLLVKMGERCYQIALVLLPNWASDAVLELTGHDEGVVIDAWRWPPFAQWAWQQIRPATPVPEASIEAGASNSQVRFSEVAVLKVQRVITQGVHVEVEMGEELIRRGATMTVPVLGQLRWRERTMGLLFAYQPQVQDGWNWFLSKASFATDDYLQAVTLLGQRTRELHRLLAEPCADQAFSPYVLTADEWQARLTLISSRMEHVRKLLLQHRSCDRRTTLLQQQYLRTSSQTHLISLKKHGLLVHRIHGDYHLGQVLRTDRDWKIIDFEGEPLRPVHERRAKDLPLRDVAGMLRSFSYGLATLGVSDPKQNVRWREAFLQGYAGEEPIDMSLLDVLELEKALYEVEYEIRTRPDWLWIPLQALCERGH